MPGLTRDGLDNCIASYFATIAPAYRLSQTQDEFNDRVQVMLCDLAGVDVPNDLANVQAASELLTLAVACLGAPLSASPGLTLPLYERCRDLAELTGYLEDSVVDAVEAINLLENATVEDKTVRRTASTPLKLNPLGKGFAVELAIYHKLNSPPPLGTQDPEYTRRETLFWIIWEADALRMAAAREPCRLSDSFIGWHGPDTSHPLSRLAHIARQICSCLLSPRAKVNGIKEADLSSIIACLDGFQLGGSPNLNLDALGTEDLFLRSTHNLLYLVCWAGTKDNKFAAQLVCIAESAAMHATERMGLLAQQVAAHNLLQSAPRAIRDQLAAFILFLVRRLNDPTTTSSDAASCLALADVLGSAVRSARLYRDSEQLASVLHNAVCTASGNIRAESGLGPKAAPTHQAISAPVGESTGDLFSNLLSTMPPEPVSQASTGDSWGTMSTSPQVNQQGVTEPLAQQQQQQQQHNLEFIDQGLFDFLASCGIDGPFVPA